jgi:hypothetical protein
LLSPSSFNVEWKIRRRCLVGKIAGRRDHSGVTSKELGLRRQTNVKLHHLKMSSPTLKAAILVISTTASKDPSADSSGGILSDVFEKEGGGMWEVVETKIVGDDVLDIQRSITGWADREEAVNVIITTGGTGFAVHDSTPEVSDT